MACTTNSRGPELLLYLLGSSRWRGCSDPRDKLYGVVSLGPPESVSSIIPDYLLAVEEIYRDMFLKYTDSSCRLELLHFCGARTSTLRIPSWVPDISTTIRAPISTMF